MSQPNPPLPKPGEVAIVKSRHIPAHLPPRLGLKNTAVSYLDSSGEERIVIIENDSPSPNDVRAAVLADARLHAQWIGQTLKL